jgi:hypothetical protein
MPSSFLPHGSVCESWRELLGDLETLERQEAAYLYPWLGEVIQASGYVAAPRWLEGLMDHADQQAGRFQALQWLVEESAPLSAPLWGPLQGLRAAPFRAPLGALGRLEWVVDHAHQKQTTYRMLLLPFLEGEKNLRATRLVELIVYAEERAARQLRDLTFALPAQGLILGGGDTIFPTE